MRKTLRVILTIMVLVAIVFWGISPVVRGWARGKYRDFPVAFQVIALVNQRFIEPVSLGRLFHSYLHHGAIEKTLAELKDPYTRYLNPAEYRELRSQTEGSFGGIGVYLDFNGDQLTVMRPIKGSPAEKAGILQGDRIIAVDGKSTANRTREQVIAAIKGKIGTEVVLLIERGDGELVVRREYRLRRANIITPTVEMEILEDAIIGKVALVNLSQFAETTAGDLENALNDAERAGVGSIILDLRYNPGGLLTSAVAVASKFVPNGSRIVRVEQRGQQGEDFRALPNSHPKWPLVVLVNEWSASAAEIVAGAIKDHKAGVLVGNTTFGKGVVQDVIPLANGGALTLTVANYRTAGGLSIHKKGIRPHVLVPVPKDVEEALKKGDTAPRREFDKSQEEKALEVLRQEILGVRQKEAA